MKLLNLSQIKKSLVKNYELVHNDDYYSLKNAKVAFGKHLVALTPFVAKKLIGKTVYAVSGQAPWYSIFESRSSVNDRMKVIKEIHIDGFDGKYLKIAEPRGKTKKFSYDAYVFNKIYSTGSGADPIFIFATRRISKISLKKKSSRKH